MSDFTDMVDSVQLSPEQAALAKEKFINIADAIAGEVAKPRVGLVRFTETDWAIIGRALYRNRGELFETSGTELQALCQEYFSK
jgi:hypothetical protein